MTYMREERIKELQREQNKVVLEGYKLEYSSDAFPQRAMLNPGWMLISELYPVGGEKVGSLYVPDTVRQAPQLGIILRVENFEEDSDVVYHPYDVVLFPKFSGYEHTSGRIKYLFIENSTIIARIAPLSLPDLGVDKLTTSA